MQMLTNIVGSVATNLASTAASTALKSGSLGGIPVFAGAELVKLGIQAVPVALDALGQAVKNKADGPELAEKVTTAFVSDVATKGISNLAMKYFGLGPFRPTVVLSV